MHLGSEARIDAMSVGVVKLIFSSNKILVLYCCLFVLSIKRNLILISTLFKQRYSILFEKNISIKLNRSFICFDKLVDGIYLITPKMYKIHGTKLNKSQKLPLKIKASSNNLTYL